MAEAPFLASVEATLGKIVFGDDLFLKHNFVHSNQIWDHADSNDDQLINDPEDVGDVVMVGVGRQALNAQDDGDDVELINDLEDGDVVVFKVNVTHHRWTPSTTWLQVHWRRNKQKYSKSGPDFWLSKKLI